MARTTDDEVGSSASPCERPQRETLRTRIGTQDRLTAFAFLVVGLAMRIPLRAGYLVNWDAVNFALGLERFDLVRHQPHPPGYIGYIALGRASAFLLGDTNGGLTMLSAVAGALAPALFYLLARRWMRQPAALFTSVLFATSPLLWYYSEVALSYVVEAAIAIPMAWACFEARRTRSARALMAAAAILALAGAVRQTSIVLLGPMALFAAAACPPRARVKAGILAVVATAVWLVPLVWSSGSLFDYITISSDLASATGGRTWLGSGNLDGLLQNVTYVAVGTALGLGVALLLPVLAIRHRIGMLRELSRDQRTFLLLWTVPTLLTYLFVHTGQLGYMLLVLPAGFLWLGKLAEAIARSPATDRRLRRPPAAAATRRSHVVAGVVVALLLNVLGFLVSPTAARAFIHNAPKEAAANVGTIPPQATDAAIRQFDLRENDRHWRELTGFVGQLDPATTVVLTDSRSRGSFRHAAFYLPEYRVYSLGYDRSQQYGHLFTARGRETNYSLEGMRDADPTLALPATVTLAVILDAPVAERLDDRVRIWPVRLRDGGWVGFVPLPSRGGTELRVSE